MMDVAVIGVGQTRYGMFPEKSLKELFHEAAMSALADVDKGLNPKMLTRHLSEHSLQEARNLVTLRQ